MEKKLYKDYVFFIPAINAAGVDLENVYGRISIVWFNSKAESGTIVLEVGDSPTPKASYAYSIDLPEGITSGSIDAQKVVDIVLASIPNITLQP